MLLKGHFCMLRGMIFEEYYIETCFCIIVTSYVFGQQLLKTRSFVLLEMKERILLLKTEGILNSPVHRRLHPQTQCIIITNLGILPQVVLLQNEDNIFQQENS